MSRGSVGDLGGPGPVVSEFLVCDRPSEVDPNLSRAFKAWLGRDGRLWVLWQRSGMCTFNQSLHLASMLVIPEASGWDSGTEERGLRLDYLISMKCRQIAQWPG